MHDVDLHVQHTRQSAEQAACPIFTVVREEWRMGGAGAVHEMLTAIGARPVMVSTRYGVTIKTRYFVDGVQVWRVDKEARPPSKYAVKDLVDDVMKFIDDVDIVLVADYGKGVCTQAVLNAAIGGAVGRKIECIVDPARGQAWNDYRDATCIKCNQAEREAADKRPACNFRPHIVETRGENGISHWPPEGYGGCYPAQRREVVDVTGCGDMVLATLGVCRAGGMAWDACCWIANAAAGLKAEQHGATGVSRAEIALDLYGRKRIPYALVPAVREAADRRKQRIVFTNGCFDLLHAGHIQCLQEAKKQGDVLVVGLNSDHSVRRLKGALRPINMQADRVLALTALECVDYIAVFNGDTPTELVRALQPDVLVKGSDHSKDTIVGADVVEARGGRVHIVQRRTGISTSILLGQAGAL